MLRRQYLGIGVTSVTLIECTFQGGKIRHPKYYCTTQAQDSPNFGNILQEISAHHQ